MVQIMHGRDRIEAIVGDIAKILITGAGWALGLTGLRALEIRNWLTSLPACFEATSKQDLAEVRIGGLSLGLPGGDLAVAKKIQSPSFIPDTRSARRRYIGSCV
jgi:hypothetical protein